MTNNQVESFRTHSNYIRAFATLVGAEIPYPPGLKYLELAQKIEQSGCLTERPKITIDHQQVLSSLKNAWGTESLINMGSYFVDESELVKISNNWSVVQVYYVLYHSTQAVAVAKGFVRPDSHPKTQRLFYNLWADRNLCLEPWTLARDFEGMRNIPSRITIDDDIHNWALCSPVSAWSLACLALKTTRDDHLDKSTGEARKRKGIERRKILRQQEAKRIKLGKSPKIRPNVSLPRLTPEEKLLVDKEESPTTIIDYFYRLRIKTNYVDSSMFTDGPENDQQSIQVRDDLNIIAGGNLLLAELTVRNIVGHDVFFKWISDWVRTNVPNYPTSAIRDRLQIYNKM